MNEATNIFVKISRYFKLHLATVTVKLKKDISKISTQIIETCYFNSLKIFMLFYILILHTYYNLYFLTLTDDSVNDEMAI